MHRSVYLTFGGLYSPKNLPSFREDLLSGNLAPHVGFPEGLAIELVWRFSVWVRGVLSPYGWRFFPCIHTLPPVLRQPRAYIDCARSRVRSLRRRRRSHVDDALVQPGYQRRGGRPGTHE